MTRDRQGQTSIFYCSSNILILFRKEDKLMSDLIWTWSFYALLRIYFEYVLWIGLAMRMRNMRFMRIMRMCGICGCGWKISSTLSTYKYLPKMATFWAKNGSAWLCFQFWVPKISLLFIPLGFIHPQEWKIRVQNHNILVKKIDFLLLLMRFMRIDAHLMRISKYRRMANPSTHNL